MPTLSPEIYEIAALVSRYLFALLGVLIVLRSFLSLLAGRRERRARLRQLPDAGMIGELVVLEGADGLPENTVLPMPREGVLGSVRSCDLTLPCPGVRRRHLDFVWDEDAGLLIHPRSGCAAVVDGQELSCKTPPASCPMRHGSFLRVGDVLLRLRIFAGLDPGAGFDGPDVPAQEPARPLQPESVPGVPLPVGMPGPCAPAPYEPVPCGPAPMPPMPPMADAAGMPLFGPPGPAGSALPPIPGGAPYAAVPPSCPGVPPAEQEPDPVPAPPPARVPRANRWKEDWSD